jgi:hypothetical protein
MCGLMQIILLSKRSGPAGRADCALRGHFVACVLDGVGLAAWGLALLGACSRPQLTFALDDVFVEALYRYKCERWRWPVVMQRSLGLEYGRKL